MKQIIAILSLIAAVLAAVLSRPWPHEERVIIKNPPGHWRAYDTLIVKKNQPPPPDNAAGIAFTGEMTTFYGKRPYLPETGVDSFRVELPTENEARMTVIVEGAELPLKTVRDLKIPPWIPGNDKALGLPTPPALPGVAWHAFEYEADTLVMWGYDAGDGQYVGQLQVHTSIPVRPDSNKVFAGYWHTGPAQQMQKPVAALPPRSRKETLLASK